MSTAPTQLVDFDSQWQKSEFEVSPSNENDTFEAWRLDVDELGISVELRFESKRKIENVSQQRPQQDQDLNGTDDEWSFDFDEAELSQPVNDFEWMLDEYRAVARQLDSFEGPSEISDEHHALQVADELAAQAGMQDHLHALSRILEQSGNRTATAKRLLQLVKHADADIDELELAFELREEWQFHAPSEQMISTAWHESVFHTATTGPTWSLCLELIRSFRGLPDIDELLLIVRTFYDDWSRDLAGAGQIWDRISTELFTCDDIVTPSTYFTTYCRRRLESLLVGVSPLALEGFRNCVTCAWDNQ